MSQLKVKRIRIDTYKENIAYLPHDCEICKSQGFRALSRIEVYHGAHSILATINMTENGLVKSGEIGLSNIAFERLGVHEETLVSLAHPNPLLSTDYTRNKLDGAVFTKSQFSEIVRDILSYRYSNIELTAFVIACAKQRLSLEEIQHLTEVMIETGEQISWDLPLVLDKHSIGGIPGNRTTMIVVPIVAAYGLPIPKTSSRAITSPAGTADTMEAITNVTLSLPEMKKVVSEENACITWGGALSLAPVDDIIISVERSLNLDSEGQMIASILSKKKAAGSTHVLIDIPVGPLAKIRSKEEAERLSAFFEKIGTKIGLTLKVLCTDGSEPIGRGIGPVLEAEDVLKVLQRDPNAPQDLRKKSLFLAAELLKLSGKVENGKEQEIAENILDSGKALEKFWAIAKSQGPLKKLVKAIYQHEIKSMKSGKILSIQNLKIAKVAKLAGAPQDPGAGVYLHKKMGEEVKKGEVLFTIFAESKEELHFAIHYVETNPDIIQLSAPLS